MSKQVVLGTSLGGNLPTAGQQFWPIQGHDVSNSNQDRIHVPWPIAGTFSELVVDVAVALTSGSIEIELFKNGSATGVKLTIDNSGTHFTDETNTVTVAAGDTLAVKSSASSPNAGPDWDWNMLFDGDTSAEFACGGGDSANAADEDFGIPSTSGWAALTIEYELIVPIDCTLDSLYVVQNVTSGTGTFRISKNGTDTGSTVTLTGGASAGNVTGLAIDLVPGDSIAVHITGLGGARRVHFGIGFTADTAGESMFGGSNDDAPVTDGTKEFTNPVAGDANQNWAAASPPTFSRVTSCGVTGFALKDLIVEVDTDPDPGSYTFAANKNGTTELSTVVINTGETQDQGSGSDDLVENDSLGISSQSASTPAAYALVHWAWAMVIGAAPAGNAMPMAFHYHKMHRAA